MEAFPEYNYASVNDENAKELEKLVNKVAEKVPKIKLDNIQKNKQDNSENDSGEGTSADAENKPNNQSENDWSDSFGKLFGNVKKKSEEISEIYKKDLNELYENVKQDATYAGTSFSSTWNKLSSNLQENYQKFQAQATSKDTPETSQSGEQKTKEIPNTTTTPKTSGFFSSFGADKLFQRAEINKLTQGFNSFIKQVIEVEAPETTSKSEKRIATDRRETQILALQSNTSTFVDDPLEDDKYHESYTHFSEKFDLETHQEQINHLLRSSTELEKIHSRLVPNVIDNGIFWCRYFFHVRQLDLMEAKRKEAAEGALASNEEIYSWGEDHHEEEDETNPNDSNISQAESTTASKSSQRSESGADPSSHTDSYEIVNSSNEESENTPSAQKGEDLNSEEADGAVNQERKEEGDDDWGVWE